MQFLYAINIVSKIFIVSTLWSVGNCGMKVAASYRDTCILIDFNVYCWGSASGGIPGTGNQNVVLEPLTSPINLGDDFLVESIDCGGWHCCAMSTNKTLKCWGNNVPHAQLGLGDISSRGNQPGEMGNNLSIIDLGSDFDVDHVSCGFYHTCVLSTENEIKCFGDNEFGQLGYGHNETIGNRTNDMGDNLTVVNLGADFIPIQVDCGSHHSCALSVDFQIKCWGWNDAGQLGQGDTMERGDNIGEMGANLTAIDLGIGFHVSSIRCGCRHVCAFSIQYNAKCWGANGVGQLGLGDSTNRGKNPGEMGDELHVLNFGVEFHSRFLGGGCSHNLILSSNGTIKAWGHNGYGQLGYGDTESRGDEGKDIVEMGRDISLIDVGDGYTVTDISVSCCSQHSCALLELSGTDFWGLKCWGRNTYGQLGLGDSALNDTKNRADEIDEMVAHLSFVTFAFATSELAQSTKLPSWSPSVYPTNEPSHYPTTEPTTDPTTDPTNEPTADPTSYPRESPTTDPTVEPTNIPSNPSIESIDSMFEVTYTVAIIAITIFVTFLVVLSICVIYMLHRCKSMFQQNHEAEIQEPGSELQRNVHVSDTDLMHQQEGMRETNGNEQEEGSHAGNELGHDIDIAGTYRAGDV